MKTIRYLLYSEILRSIFFVSLAFLALFFFFDMTDRIGDMRGSVSAGFHIGHALWLSVLLMPQHLYELLPIAVLIGTIYVMARFAQSSEFTILRTSGLTPLAALGNLLLLGLVFVIFTFVIGDYIAPQANKYFQSQRAQFRGDWTVGASGAWLKDRQKDNNYAINIEAMSVEGNMQNILIYGFDNKTGQILMTAKAQRGKIEDAGNWLLEDVSIDAFDKNDNMNKAFHYQWSWDTNISKDMIAAALLSTDKMKVLDLYQYISHLENNGQSAQNYEIAFWRKIFYPLSCLVMLVLALPFAYLHFRSGNIAAYVFFGVLIGISFFLLNNLFGFIGNLNNWKPWLASAAPSIIYSILSISIFSWLVLRQ